MSENSADYAIRKMGACRIPSPMPDLQFTEDHERVLLHSDPKDVNRFFREGNQPPAFEIAGPRSMIFFDPADLRCGIVTCGGICPGVNDVIRAIVLSLYHHYGIDKVFGFRFGYAGLSARPPHPPVELTPKRVDGIHLNGGTILGTSRGPQDIGEMVDTLQRMRIGILFAIGGDGTLRGLHAIADEIARRGLKISVIGVPKTIDNDIAYIEQSFGFETAVTASRTAIYSANIEATGAINGMGLVKLMGRHSGFIAAYATLANSDVNYCLIPEVRFSRDAFLSSLKERLLNKHHAVIVVAEGAGQELMEETGRRDASGNIRMGDIGVYLKTQIRQYFQETGMDFTLKYIDPGYTIRSMPANPHDSVFCLLLGHNAVHAGMAGRTDMVVGYWKNHFTHVPISLAASERKRIDPESRIWKNVLASTGQPAKML
ncbi:MAG: ATP-dependent 6-phosphofructokinase [Desulfobacteraceae bacterium]|nr:MAG: ATP-dependent 6-phosphofructokinase [Desulfobacteraceae bacterium]